MPVPPDPNSESVEDLSQQTESASPNEAADAEKQTEKAKPYKFVVRLPMTMRDRIAEAAIHYRRSMNSEIVARLEWSFSGIQEAADTQQLEPPMQRQLDEVFRRDLSEEESQLLHGFRRLSAEKRAALVKLLT